MAGRTVTTAAVRRIRRGQAALFVCDLQERFRDVIHRMPAVLDSAKYLIEASKVLDIPVVVTEQYPKALGRTVAELKAVLPESASVVEKSQFSMIVPEVEEFFNAKPEITQVLLCGIEAHVCVNQTALDLLQNQVDVFVLADAVSSQRESDRAVALERLRCEGAVIQTCEMALFELLGDAVEPGFKEISKLSKIARDQPQLGL